MADAISAQLPSLKRALVVVKKTPQRSTTRPAAYADVLYTLNEILARVSGLITRWAIPDPDEFVFGWYAVGGGDPPASEPYNLIIVYPDVTKAQLDYIQAQGMFAMRQVNTLDDAIDMFAGEKDVCFHPAMWGWYLYDEPNLHPDIPDATPPVLSQVYTTLKNSDPAKRPAVINLAVLGGNPSNPEPPGQIAIDVTSEFASAMDICSADHYPITVLNNQMQPAKEFDGLAGWLSKAMPLLSPPWRDAMRRLKAAAAASSKPFWAVLQAYGSPGTTLPGDYPIDLGGHQLPSANEQRYMAYTAIQEGAKGLVFWAPADGDPDGLTGAYRSRTLNGVLEDIQTNIDSFVGGRVGSVTTSNRFVTATLYHDADFGGLPFYVLLLIHDRGRIEITRVTLLDPLIVLPASTINNGSNDFPIPAGTAGSFVTGLAPYEVRIYKFCIGTSDIEIDVTINRIQDHVPGRPDVLALVQTYVRVTIGNGYQGDIYTGSLVAGQQGSAQYMKSLGAAPIRIQVWRQASQKIVHGKVRYNKKTGEYSVEFDGQVDPLPANFGSLPANEQAQLTTKVLRPSVSSGLVATTLLTFDPVTNKVTGDLKGIGGQKLHVASVSGTQAPTPDVWLTVSAKGI
jgi:hypothetical protein